MWTRTAAWVFLASILLVKGQRTLTVDDRNDNLQYFGDGSTWIRSSRDCLDCWASENNLLTGIEPDEMMEGTWTYTELFHDGAGLGFALRGPGLLELVCTTVRATTTAGTVRVVHDLTQETVHTSRFSLDAGISTTHQQTFFSWPLPDGDAYGIVVTVSPGAVLVFDGLTFTVDDDDSTQLLPTASDLIGNSTNTQLLGGGPSLSNGQEATSSNDLETSVIVTVIDGSTSTITTLVPDANSASSLTSPSRGSNTGAIVGGVVGAAVFILAVLAIIFLCLRRRRQRERQSPDGKDMFTSAWLFNNTHQPGATPSTGASFAPQYQQAPITPARSGTEDGLLSPPSAKTPYMQGAPWAKSNVTSPQAEASSTADAYGGIVPDERRAITASPASSRSSVPEAYSTMFMNGSYAAPEKAGMGGPTVR